MTDFPNAQNNPAGAIPVYTVNEPGVDTNVNIDAIGGTAVTLGQKASTASLPVVIASDQSNLPENLTQVGGSAFSLGMKRSSASMPVSQPAGAVFAIDSINATAFQKTFTIGAGGAGKYSSVQIWNPANSGKIVWVSAANLWAGSGLSVILSGSQATVGSDQGTFSCLNIGGGASASHLYTDNTASSAGSSNFQPVTVTTTSPGTAVQSVTFSIPAGYGLQYIAQTANTALNGFFNIVELNA